MSTLDGERPAGVCPRCGGPIAVPGLLAGMWSGAKANGMPAGGGVYEVACDGCSAELEAYNDIYDDSGSVPVPDQYVTPELLWGERRPRSFHRDRG